MSRSQVKVSVMFGEFKVTR